MAKGKNRDIDEFALRFGFQPAAICQFIKLRVLPEDLKSFDNFGVLKMLREVWYHELWLKVSVEAFRGDKSRLLKERAKPEWETYVENAYERLFSEASGQDTKSEVAAKKLLRDLEIVLPEILGVAVTRSVKQKIITIRCRVWRRHQRKNLKHPGGV